jgi:hypothetical protein
MSKLASLLGLVLLVAATYCTGLALRRFPVIALAAGLAPCVAVLAGVLAALTIDRKY